MSDYRREMVRRYGEAIVADIERDVGDLTPWPCRDTMDGRQWCRVHDAPWPSWQAKPRGCDAWVAAKGDG